jgi:hypothetical protein
VQSQSEPQSLAQQAASPDTAAAREDASTETSASSTQQSVLALDTKALQEQLLREINRVRGNPRALLVEAESLLPLFQGTDFNPPFLPARAGVKGTIETREGAAAVRDLVQFLGKQPPRPPLASCPAALCAAAADHALDIGGTGAVSHAGADGCGVRERVERYAEWSGSLGESLAFGVGSGHLGKSAAADVVMQVG